jgi:hypothetical protein
MGYYAGLICIVNYVHSYVQQVYNVRHFDQIIYLVIKSNKFYLKSKYLQHIT